MTRIDADAILAVLDESCDAFNFPMLDNGYVYLAATRLSLFRSAEDWAMVIEMFGYSPRSALPDTSISTFASRLNNRKGPQDYVTLDAYHAYLEKNPNNESEFVFPVAEGAWQDPDEAELVANGARDIVVRGKTLDLPAAREYARHSITLEEAPRIQVFELCRWLAAVARDDVLATPYEQRLSVLPETPRILQLDEWHHPDIADAERPSGSPTFRQLAEVLATGDPARYRPSVPPNTHWRHWPEGGTL